MAINTKLTMKDNMSPALKTAAGNVKALNKETALATKRVGNKFVNVSDKIGNLAGKIVKYGATTAATLSSLAIGKGLSEAMDMEGYKSQLETATKSTKKASEIMTYAINLANKTPFEGGEMVEAASKFEAMGLSAKKYLTITGDMAGATNKSMDQATEAIIDAQTGELERLKEFGVTKAMIAKKAGEMYKGQEIINSKGQIVDQKKFNTAMIAVMKDKFTGGMEKQAGTLKGVWSTVTGVTKSALANMVGMGTDGTVKQGSLLELLKGKAQILADKLQKWQQDGTIEKIGNDFTKGLNKAIKAGKKAFQFFKDNRKTIKILAATFGGLTASIFTIGKTIKTIRKVKNTIKDVKDGINNLKLTGKGFIDKLSGLKSKISPKSLGIMLIITAIALIVIAVYKNWDKIKPVIDKVIAKVKKIWEKIKEVVKNIKEFVGGIIDWIKEKVGAVVDWISDKVDKVKGFIGKVKGFFGGNKSKDSSIGENANGTQYWRGGQTVVGEHGPEIVDLPRGSKVKTATTTKSERKAPNINVHVTIQGNVIGNEAFADQMANKTCKKVLAAIGNA